MRRMHYSQYVILGVRVQSRFVVALAVCAASISLTGCGDSLLTGGDVVTDSYPPVAAPMSTEAGQVEVPRWWPSEVPLPRGRYRELKSSHLDERTRALEVSNVGPDSFEQAGRLLVAAGFVKHNFLGRNVFMNSHHMVTATVADDGYGDVLIYTLSDAMNLPGMQGLGSIDIDSLLGGEG